MMNTTTPWRSPGFALLLLTTVNMLNYIDRQVLYAVFPLIKTQFSLSDTALGLLGSAFMICYMVAAPLLGRIGDHYSRVRLSAMGLALWSLATACSGLASGYRTLLVSRSLVGIGEASFGTVSPGLVADYYPRERRGQVLSWFYLAIPVGSALGYLLGGQLGQLFGWQAAFLLVGLPGLLLAIPVWRLWEPLRGCTEAAFLTHTSTVLKATSLRHNRPFVYTTLSMAAMTFALGGLAQWMPSFLQRMHGLDVARGNTLFGAITVLAGMGGTLCGGWLGDRMQQRTAQGYLLVAGGGFVLGAPLAIIALLSPSVHSCLLAVFFAEFFLFLNTGPLNTVLVNVSAPSIRATAFAVNIFVIHALGDAVSPAIIGRLSDHWGLRTALLITPLAIATAALLAFIAGRHICRGTEQPL